MLHFNKLIEFVVPVNIAIFVIAISGLYPFSFDEHRLFELEIICFNLLLLLMSTHYRHTFIKQFFYFSPLIRNALLGLLLLAVLSVLFAPLKNYAMLELGSFIGLFLLSLSIANLSFQNPLLFQKAFTGVFITGAFVYQIIFFSGYSASVIENIPLEWPEPFTGFANIRFFNQYHLWLYFLISFPLLKPNQLHPLLRSGLYLIAIGWAVLLFVSGSRGAIIAIFTTLGFMALFYRKPVFAFIKLHAILLFLGFIGAMFLFKFLPSLSQAGDTAALGWRTVQQMTDNSPRLYLWRLALDYITAHPFLGIGPMQYAYYSKAIALHPHNSFLQWASEFGLPSVFIVTTLIGRGIWQWLKSLKDDLQKNETIANDFQIKLVLFCTLLANLIYSQVDGVMVMPVSQVLMATLAGWMLGLYFHNFHSDDTDNMSANMTIKNISAQIFVGATLITLIYAVFPGLLQKQAELSENGILIKIEIQQPRFWEDGKIS